MPTPKHLQHARVFHRISKQTSLTSTTGGPEASVSFCCQERRLREPDPHDIYPRGGEKESRRPLLALAGTDGPSTEEIFTTSRGQRQTGRRGRFPRRNLAVPFRDEGGRRFLKPNANVRRERGTRKKTEFFSSFFPLKPSPGSQENKQVQEIV